MGLIAKAKQIKKKKGKKKNKIKPRLNLTTGKVRIPGKKKVDLNEIKKKIDKKIKQKKAEKINLKDIKNSIQEKIGKSKKREEEIPVSKNRIATGIPGLDEVMGGGFEKNSVNLIGGGAGAGKSIFCMQFIVNGVKDYNEPGIYISFEESKAKFYKHMKPFGWDLEKIEKEGKFSFIEYSPDQVQKLMKEGGGLIENVVKKMNAKRLVLDSLTAFTLLHGSELSMRQACLDLFELFREWGITSLFVSEQEPDLEKHKSTTMEFEVDGVILLYNVRKGDVRERSLEVFKIRGSPHAQKIYPMKIDDVGLTIYPEETVF